MLKSNRKRSADAAGPADEQYLAEDPRQAVPVRIEYFFPGEACRPLQAEYLSAISLGLQAVLVQPDLATIQAARALAVLPHGLLARMIPAVELPPGGHRPERRAPAPLPAEESRIQVGEGVRLTEDGEYRAEHYGYMCLVQGKLSVVPPLWLNADEMGVYWLILDERAQAVTPEMIYQHLDVLGVVEGIDREKIARLAGQQRAGKHRRGAFLIATGQVPENGRDAQVEILADITRRVGTEREDGSIDFREVNFTPNVKPEQLVARRVPPTLGSPGRDVKGRVRVAAEGKDRVLRAGEHVRVEVDGHVELFYATIGGVLDLSDDILSVVEMLTIDGDVDFNTGNLDFEAQVCIRGSVIQGFSVKARGDITIGGTVEPGALVVSHKDIAVGRGIVGRRTKVVAGESVHAQFVQEAAVTAGKSIRLGNYAYHALLRAGEHVVISRAKGSNSGSIMGGRVWAGAGIKTYTAGTPNGTATVLAAGVDPDQAQELDRVEHKIETISTHISRLLEQFGLEQVQMDHIRNMLRAATGPRRKLLAHRARQLGQLIQVYQQLLASREGLRERLGSSFDHAEIRVWDRAFPGVEIRISQYRCKVLSEVKAARFHIQDGKLVER